MLIQKLNLLYAETTDEVETNRFHHPSSSSASPNLLTIPQTTDVAVFHRPGSGLGASTTTTTTYSFHRRTPSKRTRLMLRSSANQTATLTRARSRTLRLTLLILLTFIFCWTPYVVMTLW